MEQFFIRVNNSSTPKNRKNLPYEVRWHLFYLLLRDKTMHFRAKTKHPIVEILLTNKNFKLVRKLVKIEHRIPTKYKMQFSFKTFYK